MRHFFLLPMVLLLAFSGHTQDLKPVYKGNPPFDPGDNILKQPPPQASATSGKGSLRPTEYLFTTWSRGTLKPYNGPARQAWLMYNAFSRQLVERVLVGKSDDQRAVDMRLLREFTVGDSARNLRLTYRRYLNTRVAKPSLRTAFYEVHYDAGRTALLCQRTHSFGPLLASTENFTGGNDVLRYYIKTTDNQIIPVTLRASEVLAALGPTHAVALKAYVEAHQLNLENEGEVVRLLVYHDSL